MRKKIKDSGGFTMVEMLCVVAILVLLCLMTNTGLSMAMATYRDITAESEARLLLNDLSDALADKLRYAIVTSTNTAGVVSVNCSVETVSENDGMIVVDGKALLSTGAYGSKLPGGSVSGNNRRYVVETAGVSRDDTGPTPVFTVDLKVKDTLGGVSAQTLFKIRCLNPIKVVSSN